MAFTKAQARAWSTGTQAAIKRQKERVTTVVSVTRDDEIVKDEQITGVLSWSLVEHGPLPASTTRIEILDIAHLHDRMAEQEAEIEQAHETIRRQAAEIAALKAASQPQPPPLLEQPQPKKDVRWGTVRQAAALHGVSETTMRRACADGRIRCKRDTVSRYSHYFVDLDSAFVRAPGSLKTKK